MFGLTELIQVPLAAAMLVLGGNQASCDGTNTAQVIAIGSECESDVYNCKVICEAIAGDGTIPSTVFVKTSYNAVNDDVESIQVVRINDDVKVTINGKVIANDRVIVKPEGIIILDKDGKVLREIKMPGAAGEMIVLQGEDGKKVLRSGGGILSHARPAKGQIGVVLGQLDKILADHLGIEDEGAFVISEVMDGLPAHKAGVKKHDIVIRINSESASIDRLLELVGECDAGEKIKLHILRKGQPHDISIVVAEAKQYTPFEGSYEFKFDTDEDVDFDFDINFEGLKFEGIDGNKLRDKIRQQIQEQMKNQVKSGRFKFDGVMEKLQNLPQLKELHLDNDKLQQLRLRWEEAGGHPFQALKKFGLDPEVWVEIQTNIEDALKEHNVEIPEEIRIKIDTALKEGLGKAKLHLRELGEGEDGLRLFKMIPGGKEEGHVIFLEEGDVNTTQGIIRSKGIEKTVVEGDRIKRLEDRLKRLEALLEKLVDKLDDDDLP